MKDTTKPALAPVLAVNFVGTLGYSLVLPFLVYVVNDWGGNALIYGLLGATYSAFQLVGAPLLGRWSDSIGRRRVLLLSQYGTLASWGLFLIAFFLSRDIVLIKVDGDATLGTFALTLPLVVAFIARAADGLTGGNVSVANAYLADISSEKDRSANFGKMAVSSNLGFIVGPALAGLLGATALGAKLPVIAAIVVSAVAAALILWRLPESQPCVIERKLERNDTVRGVLGGDRMDCYRVQKKTTIRKILALPAVPLQLAVYFMVMLGFNFFYIAFPMHAATALEWPVIETGVFFSVLSLMMVAVQGPILARASRRWDERTLIAVGAALLAGSFALFTLPETGAIYGGAALLALGNGLMWPSLLSALSKCAGKDAQGTVQGFASSIGAGASIAGLVLGGLLYASMGGDVFLVSVAIIAPVVLMALGIPTRFGSAGRDAGSDGSSGGGADGDDGTVAREAPGKDHAGRAAGAPAPAT